MTTQELIEEILAKNRELTREQILGRLEAERARTGALLGDETLLRLIAAKLGVEVKQNHFHNHNFVSTSRLFAGLYDVTVAGRLIAVFPAKSFQGAEKSGKFATLMMADDDGLLRVVLWNEKAELVERGELKAGQAVRLLHGYTRDDRYGKTELHLGSKSQVEIEPQDQASSYPSIEKYATKIQALNSLSGNAILLGTVKAVLGKKTFKRSDNTEGTVMRLTLADDSAVVTVVAWDEKVAELENIQAETRLLLVNARVKDAQNGAFEVHVDSNTFVDIK
jgi:replication factor A1